jgi:glycosyltransferase involved in cell wall biosynthesis
MDTLLRPGVRVTFSCEAQRARLLERLSPRVAEKLLSRSVVRPMGIRVRQIASGDREGTRKLLGISGFTVLFLGRLVPVKRPLLLRELAVRMPHATFMVAGDGPLREILETRIEQAGLWDRFRMLGTVGEKVKADLFAACDAVVLPSGEVKGGRTEGAPVAVLEALAAGRPVVASDVGGVGEWVRHRETGMLCPAEDIDSMVEGLEELRIDESLRFELSRNARSVGARQDWSEVIATYDRLLEEAVRDYA